MTQTEKLAAIRFLAVFFFPMLMWCITAFILTAGILFSFWSDEWNCFSRSGSLVVVIALITASLDYKSESRKFISSTMQDLDEPSLIQDRVVSMIVNFVRKKEMSPDKLNDEELKQYIFEFSDHIAGLMNERAQRSEIKIAALGTLIWGFGDVFGRLF